MKKTLTILIVISVLMLTACRSASVSDGHAADAALTSEAPIRTEAPEITAEPFQAHSGPLPALDRELCVLVDFAHRYYKEPDVVLIHELLTAHNVIVDPRRHADERAVKALNEMLLAAEEEAPGKFCFLIASAYRAAWEQEVLWNAALAEDPEIGTDPYNRPVGAMPPNCSEHQTGLAFDILSASCPHGDPDYAKTPEGKWLAENAHRFGFIMRYPEDKQSVTGVKYEPWHYRYVGAAAAEYIYSHGITLEEFLSLYGE